MTPLTFEEHRARHVQLHKYLDELVADFLTHNPSRLPSKTTLMEFMQWTYQQTINPDTPEEETGTFPRRAE